MRATTGAGAIAQVPGDTMPERDTKCMDKALRHGNAHDALTLFFRCRIIGGVRYLVERDLVELQDVYSEAVARGDLVAIEYATRRGFRPSAAFLERQLGRECVRPPRRCQIPRGAKQSQGDGESKTRGWHAIRVQ